MSSGYTFLNTWEIKKPRKLRRCWCCNILLNVGEPCAARSGVADGCAYTLHECTSCHTIVEQHDDFTRKHLYSDDLIPFNAMGEFCSEFGYADSAQVLALLVSGIDPANRIQPQQ